MPRFTKRTAGTAHQDLPQRPVELLLPRLWDLWSSRPLLSPQGHIPQVCWISPKLPPLRLPWSPLDHTPKIYQAGDPQAFMISCRAGDLQACMVSAWLGHTPQACTGSHNLCSTGHAPKASQASDPQAFMIFARMCLSGLHRCAWPPLCHAPQARIHRHAQYPFAGPMSFRHVRPMFQRSDGLPQWQASTRRPMGPHPPATCHRRAPNLPSRQTSLHVEGIKAELLRLKFHCSWTSDFLVLFIYFLLVCLPSCKGLAAWLAFWSSTISPCCFPWYSLFSFFSFYFSFFLYILLLPWLC
jgi:hypothetical protein